MQKLTTEQKIEMLVTICKNNQAIQLEQSKMINDLNIAITRLENRIDELGKPNVNDGHFPLIDPITFRFPGPCRDPGPGLC
jgi:hypothetical protein